MVIKVKWRNGMTTENYKQNYSTLRYSLECQSFETLAYVGCFSSIIQTRNGIIMEGSKFDSLTCRSKQTLSLPAYNVSVL